MDYVILDSAGNALASFSDELTARATIHAMVRVEPDAAEHIALLGYDDEGMPVGEALGVMDVEPPVTISMSLEGFLQPLTAAAVRATSRTSYRGFVPAAGVRIPA
jgi:hypothetical protein